MEKHSQKYKVVIIQKRLAQYRKPFFESLKVELLKNNVELIFIYGQPSDEELKKKDNVFIDWAIQINNREIKVGSFRFLWQPCLSYLQNVDLIIVEQASKLLLNYWLFLTQPFRKTKLCFWGHGKNFQIDKSSKAGEYFKKIMSRNVYWWFAYNDLSANIVKHLGFPEKRITSVQNAFDTLPLIHTYNNITEREVNNLRRENNINSENVCLYVGSMYREKRINFLLEACKLIRAMIPDFEMVFIGAGPDEKLVKNAVKTESWLHYQGTIFGQDKVAYFKLAKLLLMPGAVGLSIIDAFAMETPIVTMNTRSHGPEIDYLKHGENGMMVDPADDVEKDEVEKYAHTVAEIMMNRKLLAQLKKGCLEAREIYTMEAMTKRFANGIMEALANR